MKLNTLPALFTGILHTPVKHNELMCLQIYIPCTLLHVCVSYCSNMHILFCLQAYFRIVYQLAMEITCSVNSV